MSIMLRDLLWEICLWYLHDIIIFGRTPQELLNRMRTVPDRLRQVALKVKLSKCVLFKTEIQYLGHLVSAAKIHPMQEKVQALCNFPVPQCVRDVRAFVGLASYYRKFVKGFATIAEPLTRLTSKQMHFEWTPEAQAAFKALKQALMEATSLAFPIPNVTCILDTDASEVAIGAVLSQKIDGTERPIAFFSRAIKETQRKYCTTRRELLAVVCAVQHFRHYLFGIKVILRTDHYSLKWLRTFKTPEGILARWIETEFVAHKMQQQLQLEKELAEERQKVLKIKYEAKTKRLERELKEKMQRLPTIRESGDKGTPRSIVQEKLQDTFEAYTSKIVGSSQTSRGTHDENTSSVHYIPTVPTRGLPEVLPPIPTFAPCITGSKPIVTAGMVPVASGVTLLPLASFMNPTLVPRVKPSVVTQGLVTATHTVPS